jgi:hypothetical protein
VTLEQKAKDGTATGNGSPAPGLPAPENLERVESAAPRDYLALNAAYGALLAGLVAANRRRGEHIPATELVPLGAATFALSKTIARERIGTWVREPFVEEDAPGRPPRGRRLRYALGELVTCSRCVGAWSALALVGLRTASPQASRTVTSVLALAGVNDFLQVGFRALCEQVNVQAARAHDDQ